MSEIEKIVAKLSVAQKNAILCAKQGVVPSYYPTALRISTPTFRALRAHGLTEFWPPKLTNLGLEVRHHLENSDAQG